MKFFIIALLAALNLFSSEGWPFVIASRRYAAKECVQAGMVAANLKQDYGAAEKEKKRRVFGLI